MSENHQVNRATRRSVLGAAAWGVPAVTVASVLPAYAASTAYDLSIQTFRFNEPSNWTNPAGTVDALYGTGYLTWRVRLCNNSDVTAPAGTLLRIGMGMGPYFQNIDIITPSALNVVRVGSREDVAHVYGDDDYYRSYMSFRVNQPIAKGCTDLHFRAFLRRTPIEGFDPVVAIGNPALESKSYLVNTLASLTAPDGRETVPGNNADTSDYMKEVRLHVNSNDSTAAIANGTYTPLPAVAPTTVPS